MGNNLKVMTVRFTSFWRGDGAFSALLALLFASYFLAPLIEGVIGQLLLSIFFTLLLVSGISEVSRNILHRILAGLVAAFAIILHWVQDLNPHVELAFWLALSSLLYFLLLTWVVLRRAFQAGPVSSHRVREAVAAYILLAISWSYIYQLIEILSPGAFNLTVAAGAAGERHLQVSLTYFSFVTLTTLGYGDITPLHSSARMFVIMEALMGQLYPATLLARLVSLEMSSRQDSNRQMGSMGNKPDSNE
jgi:hypothetical protein